MTRLIGTLVLLTLFAPVALAAADAPEVADATAPSVPDLRPVGRAIASGAASAAEATGDALASVGRGVANLASAVGHALAALGSALASVAVALGRAMAFLAAAIFAGVGAVASFLGGLLGSGARLVAAHPKESAIVAGTASGAGLLAYAVKKWWLGLFVPLYSRLARSEMLDNKVRASVFEHVKANPGAHPSAIAETVGIGWGTVVYHLARLEESQLVTPRSAHHRKCYFAVGSDLDGAGRTAVAAMSTDKGRAIVDALRAAPGLSQKELAERIGISQALLSWHVKRLLASGVLVSTRSGRSNLLAVADHVPIMAQTVAALAA